MFINMGRFRLGVDVGYELDGAVMHAPIVNLLHMASGMAAKYLVGKKKKRWICWKNKGLGTGYLGRPGTTTAKVVDVCVRRDVQDFLVPGL